MLDSSRKRDLRPEPMAVDALLDATIELFADRLELQDMQLEKQVEPGLPPVEVDAEQMRMALLNLCINAIEAMEPGLGVLRLQASLEQERPVLRISDNGRGIPAELMDRLFDPFVTGRKGGMGLGLTTTRAILHAHNVQLDMQSTPGAGTTAVLRFPRSARSADGTAGADPIP
jgi:signal transduction histidine kinase